MNILPSQYKKNSYTHTAVRRTGNIAVYHLTDNGKSVGYEVFIVKQNAERVIGGVQIPAGESTPSNEEWGTTGYTVTDLSRVPSFEEILQKRIDNRKIEPIQGSELAVN